MATSAAKKGSIISSEAGRAAPVPIALFVALAANSWHATTPHDLDQRVFAAINADGHGLVFRSAEVISLTASPFGGAALVAIATAVVWWRSRDVVASVAVTVAAGLAAVLQNVGKAIVQRPRPLSAQGLTGLSGYAFPSGHATGISALITVLSLLIMANRLTIHRSGRAIGALVTFGVLVSFTRLLTGAHYMTDVVGGLALGTAISCLVIAALPLADGGYARLRIRRGEEPRPASHPTMRQKKSSS